METPEPGAERTASAHLIAIRLRQFSERTGAVIAWLTLPMVAATFLIAFARYAFALNWIWLQELVVWLHALVFMLGAAYTLNRDEHVRVDIFYRKLSQRGQAWVELVGCLVFLVPVSLLLIWMSVDYVLTSWSISEGSNEVGGLPYPFVPLLKSVIPLAFVLILIQGAAIMLDAVVQLRTLRGASD